MSGPPSWTPEQFERLLNTSSWSRPTLARRLPGHTREEIIQLRTALHAYHAVGDATDLEPWMLERLATRRRRTVCAVCGSRF